MSSFAGSDRPVPVPERSRAKVTHCGWFAFEGFGRPFEAWVFVGGGWRSYGRAFTYRRAKRKARAALARERREAARQVIA